MSSAINAILDAAAFPSQKHSKQRRKDFDESPYINHPLALASLLSECGIEEPAVLMAALLHDTIEDTKTTREELAERFGERVASIVSECTDDKGLDQDVRKSLQVTSAAKKSRGAREAGGAVRPRVHATAVTGEAHVVSLRQIRMGA